MTYRIFPTIKNNRLNQWILAVALLASNTVVVAQQETSSTADDADWYQVEVFIFANDTPYAGGAEHWPKDVELQYPEPIVRLEEAQFSTAEDTGNALDSGPELSQSPLDAEARPDAHNREQAFITLPREEQQLNNQVARINRQRDFRLLFHQAWRQPVLARDQSTNILIRGGERFDDHYELEGSINLSVERYLHFKTDLWLSTFKSAAGLDYYWPKLPPLPLPPREQQGMAFSQPVDNPFGIPETGSTLSLLYLSGRQYQVDRTVVLRQSRRMRSGELHYIDHPLMGVLVKVTPYEIEPPPAESALEERSTAEDTY